VELAQERDMLAVWVYLPVPELGASPVEIEGLVRLAQEAGLVTLELSHAYDGYDLDSLAVAPWDRHPNRKGHALLAEQLYAALEENALVPLFGGDQSP
jgi:hypothetical protein